MATVVKKPLIQEYHDYLEFLIDWIDYLKVREKGFSLRQVAKEAGMASGYLPMCFSRKRKLSKRSFAKLLPHLMLTPKETRYLELLQVIAESEDPKDRVKALTELQRLKDYRESHQLELEVHQYLSRWYYVAIRELVNTADFKEDPAWIQDRLRGRISQKEIEEALAFLVQFRFIEKNADGKYLIVQKQLDCHEGVFKISLGEFHRQMLDWAKVSIEEVPRADRLLLGHTTAITRDQFELVQGILKKALNDLESVENATVQKGMEVYHIELTAFPLTQNSSVKDGSVGE
ncbi:DUF4423 domain-containing protein [Bdellovibrio bacteriovorus]|uniref:DUF4423 domain-containing protein n=1 Tax=Bdellovibrio bacteriovorus TaxID=959 RepID=UPI003AA937E4